MPKRRKTLLYFNKILSVPFLSSEFRKIWWTKGWKMANFQILSYKRETDIKWLIFKTVLWSVSKAWRLVKTWAMSTKNWAFRLFSTPLSGFWPPCPVDFSKSMVTDIFVLFCNFCSYLWTFSNYFILFIFQVFVWTTDRFHAHHKHKIENRPAKDHTMNYKNTLFWYICILSWE